MRKIILTALFALAACSQPAQQQTTATSASATSSSSVAAASDQPSIRAGSWQSVSTSPGKAAETQTSCATGSLADFLGTSDNCQAPSIARTADGWSFDAQCSADGDHETFHADIHGDLQSHFTVDIPGGHGNTAVHSDNHYVGACQTP